MQQEIKMPDQPILDQSNSELQAEDILDILNDDSSGDNKDAEDKDTPRERTAGREKSQKEDEDTEEDDTEEEDETSEEDDEDGEDEEDHRLELEEPMMEPASRKAILAKYPDLFKNFPWLEHAHYRNNEFSQIFPTIEEAKEAAERVGILNDIENTLRDGDSKSILQQVKNSDPSAFAKLVDNYLINLGQVDKDAYFHVLGNVTKSTIQAMLKTADKEQSKPLKAAAEILNHFIFGTRDITPPSRLSQEESSDDSKLKQERAEFIREQFRTVSDELYTETRNLIKANIQTNIDPRGKMAPYVKKKAVEDALNSLENVIKNDRGFRTSLDRLWERALQNKFSKEAKTSIKSAYLHRAKSILPEAIKSARREALRGTGHREEKDRKGPLSIGRSSSNNRGKDSPGAKKIPPGMSTLDYLNMD